MNNDTITPERLKELIGTPSEDDIKEQERLLKLHRSRARLSPGDLRMARGIELERVHRQDGKTNNLAMALAMQGRYEEAIRITTDTPYKRALMEREAAVHRSDNDCLCDNFTEENGYRLPTQYVEFYGYSDRHGKEMPFIRCTICKDLNAKPLPSHLAEQQAMRHSDAPDTEKLKFFKI